MLLSVQSPLPDAQFTSRALPMVPGVLPLSGTFAAIFEEISAPVVTDSGPEAPTEVQMEMPDESQGADPVPDMPAPEADMEIPPPPQVTMVSTTKMIGENAQHAEVPRATTMQLAPAAPKELEGAGDTAPAAQLAGATPAAELAPAPHRRDMAEAVLSAHAPNLMANAGGDRATTPSAAVGEPPKAMPEATRGLPLQPQPEPPEKLTLPNAPIAKEVTPKAEMRNPSSPLAVPSTLMPVTPPMAEVAPSAPPHHPAQDLWAQAVAPSAVLVAAPPKPALPEPGKPAALPALALAAHESAPAPARTEAIAPASAPEPPARQILQAIQAQPPLPTGGSGRIEVVLSPAELGRVEITFTPKDATTVITFSAERPETADLLRRNIDVLLEDLRKLGFGEAQFGFAGNRGQNAPRVPLFHPGSQTISPLSPTQADAPRSGRLDLRM